MNEPLPFLTYKDVTSSLTWEGPVGELFAALGKAQTEFGVLASDATGQVGPREIHYATLGAVFAVTKEPLAANGLTLVQFPYAEGERVGVETVVYHSSGQMLRSRLLLPVRQDSQGYGSGITYARRYAWTAICGLAVEDDDGAGAMPKNPPRGGQRRNTPGNRPESPVGGFDPDDEGRRPSQSRQQPPGGAQHAGDPAIGGWYASAAVLGFKHDEALRFTARETMNGTTPSQRATWLKEMAAEKRRAVANENGRD